MSVPITTADVLRKARELYAANPSHATVTERLRDGSHCVISALCRAVHLDPPCEEYNLAREAFINASNCGPFGIIPWNAEHSTADVLAAFDCAITAVSS